MHYLFHQVETALCCWEEVSMPHYYCNTLFDKDQTQLLGESEHALDPLP